MRIIQNMVDISLRPSIVDEKNLFGEYVIYTIICKNHNGVIMTTNTHLVLNRSFHEGKSPLINDIASCIKQNACINGWQWKGLR